MGFRFQRRIRLGPGMTLNLSKSSASLSFGTRGARYTVGRHGRRVTTGIPGTGLSYTTYTPRRGAEGGGTARRGRAAGDDIPPSRRLTLGFFKRLVTPKDEEALVDGCREFALGRETQALRHLGGAAHLADGAYLAGLLHFKRGQLDEARRCLETAVARQGSLGHHFDKYGVVAWFQFPITEELAARVEPRIRGVLLALAEVHQQQGHLEEALARLEELHGREPDDVVVRVSLAEVLMDLRPDDPGTCKRIVRLGEGVENQTQAHAALMLHRARALRQLDMPTAARELLSKALRKKKDRGAELLQALRYERALAYEDLGQARRARSDLERLYAENPDYEDVAARLGLEPPGG